MYTVHLYPIINWRSEQFYQYMSSGLAWEEEVANFLEARGFQTWVRRTVSEHEIDVYARKDGNFLVVECKDWGRPVAPDAVRQVNSVATDIGASAAIAYTSELSEGAQSLAERWGIVILSSDIVRDTTIKLDDLGTLVESHEIALPNVSNLSRFTDPLGPFQVADDFAATVAKSVKKKSIEAINETGWLERRIENAIRSREAKRCVPILRHDSGALELYFITETPTEIFPAIINSEIINLG